MVLNLLGDFANLNVSIMQAIKCMERLNQVTTTLLKITFVEL